MATSLHCLKADKPGENEDLAAFNRLAVGDGVDAKDTTHFWYHGRVVEKTEQQQHETGQIHIQLPQKVRITYEGWSDTWNE